MSKFYTFRQNNSGGSFTVNDKDGIGKWVIIEATSIQDANTRAQHVGLYFHGVDEGYDCECCGDRWNLVDEYDEHDKPKVYDEYIDNDIFKVDNFDWGLPLFIHYMNGDIKRIDTLKSKGKKFE